MVLGPGKAPGGMFGACAAVLGIRLVPKHDEWWALLGPCKAPGGCFGDPENVLLAGFCLWALQGQQHQCYAGSARPPKPRCTHEPSQKYPLFFVFSVVFPAMLGYPKTIPARVPKPQQSPAFQNPHYLSA